MEGGFGCACLCRLEIFFSWELSWGSLRLTRIRPRRAERCIWRPSKSEDKACSIPWKGREAKHGFAAMLDGRTKALFRVIQLLLDGWFMS
uniref:Uncharacterized protein n=1 Tax=Oryza meridionalis TaxID=40149 RepID=A0A0E0D9T8_9ORYZ